MNLRITKVKWNIKAFKTAYGKVFIKDESTGIIYEKEFVFNEDSYAINNTNYIFINNILYKLINKGGLFTPNLELIKM